ncbi:MAG: hypothetical protein Q8L24_02430 [bacterium]|nr:hypothetical protein [bacterium]
MEKTSEGKLLELTVRIFSDGMQKRVMSELASTPDEPQPFVMYLVGQTAENENSVLEPCRQIAEVRADVGLDTVICLAESQFPPEKRKYPNFAVDWKEKLGGEESGMEFSTFRFPEGPVEHTGTEMIGLVAHAEEQNWSDVLLIASPWHQLRSFLSAVSAAKKQGSKVRFWNLPGLPLLWTEQSVHSQGVQTGKRVDFIHAELAKVLAYSARGDIATVDEGIEYLNWRDAQK